MRGYASWLGLIGSASKAARFRSRLLRNGVNAPTLTGLTCPIGIAGITSKLPAAIAIAVAAQLLQQLDIPVLQAARAPVQIAVDELQPCTAACKSCGSARQNQA
jgi:xanthine dehydrogenase accessory factor